MRDIALSIILSALFHAWLLVVPSHYFSQAQQNIGEKRASVQFYKVSRRRKKRLQDPNRDTKSKPTTENKKKTRNIVKKQEKQKKAKKVARPRRKIKKIKKKRVKAPQVPRADEMPLPSSAYQSASTKRKAIHEQKKVNSEMVNGLSNGEKLKLVRFIAHVLRQRLRYPRRARRKRQKGKVLLSFILEPSGEATHIQLSKSSGYELLDSAALRTVSKCSPFAIKRKYKVPETGLKLILPITFSLGKE